MTSLNKEGFDRGVVRLPATWDVDNIFPRINIVKTGGFPCQRNLDLLVVRKDQASRLSADLHQDRNGDLCLSIESEDRGGIET